MFDVKLNMKWLFWIKSNWSKTFSMKAQIINEDSYCPFKSFDYWLDLLWSLLIAHSLRWTAKTFTKPTTRKSKNDAKLFDQFVILMVISPDLKISRQCMCSFKDIHVRWNQLTSLPGFHLATSVKTRYVEMSTCQRRRTDPVDKTAVTGERSPPPLPGRLSR